MSLSGGFSIFGCANSGSTKNDEAAYGDEKGPTTVLHREKDKYQYILIFGDKYQYILIFLNTSYVPNSRFVMCRTFYYPDISKLLHQRLFLSKPGGDTCLVQSRQLGWGNDKKSKCIDICPQ
jgi:hypothetical protein